MVIAKPVAIMNSKIVMIEMAKCLYHSLVGSFGPHIFGKRERDRFEEQSEDASGVQVRCKHVCVVPFY